MNSFQKIGGISALICAATYLVSLGLLFTLLAPFLDDNLEFGRFMAFLTDHQAIVFLWHLTMYLVNGVFLVILILALYDRLKAGSPAMAQAGAVFGLIWAVLVFASGLITIYGLDVILNLYTKDPNQAATLKLALDLITTGLDHSDRFLGCWWVLLVSWAALRTGDLSRPLNYLGMAIGLAGLASTIAPALTELGVAFGLGVIVWWSWLGMVLLRSRSRRGVQTRPDLAQSALA